MPGLLWTYTDIGTATLVVATVAQYTKFLLNYVIDPTGPNQNNWVRLYVYLLSLAIVWGIGLVAHQITDPLSGIGAMMTGGVVASLAILEYQVLTSDAIPSFLPSPKGAE